MSGQWKETGARGELGADRTFVENAATGQTGSVLTLPTGNRDFRLEQVGQEIGRGNIQDLTPPKS